MLHSTPHCSCVFVCWKAQKKSREVFDLQCMCFCRVSPAGLFVLINQNQVICSIPSQYLEDIQLACAIYPRLKGEGGGKGKKTQQNARELSCWGCHCSTGARRARLASFGSAPRLGTWPCGEMPRCRLTESADGKITLASRGPKKQKGGGEKERKKKFWLITCVEKAVTSEVGRRGNRPVCTPTFHFCVSDDPLKLWRDGWKLCQCGKMSTTADKAKYKLCFG